MWKKVIALFSFWRLFLFIPIFLSPYYLQLKNSFLGGGLANYLSIPALWSWANFDGEHYLSIAQSGYRPLTYFFFPLYPLLLKNIHSIFGTNLMSYLLPALFISNLSLLLALFGLTRLLSLDYKKNIIWITMFLLLFFPTSFYFAGVYTESLFLALVVWSFYFARKGNWLFACILASLSTATRLVGIIMLPALVVEFFYQKSHSHDSKRNLLTTIMLVIIPMGILLYMYFLLKNTGDPLAFFHSVEVFGQQRSTQLTPLPQVLYRYVFKIIPFVPLSFFPLFFVTWMEFITGIAFFVLSLIAILKLRLSYGVYSLGAYLIPTLSGSFSSLPRYTLVLFPAFLVFALYFNKWPKVLKIITFLIMLISLLYAESLFVRGYWVS